LLSFTGEEGKLFMSSNFDQNASASRDKLVEDVKVLSKDVQDLLKATASVVGERAVEARGKVQASLKVAQEKLGTVQETARVKGREAAVAADEYVRDNPWNAVGIAAGIGFLVGLTIAAGSLASRSDD
jgi:ElaB/YqjD/DUF883 family membrane-anchored ribosome-binding protein